MIVAVPQCPFCGKFKTLQNSWVGVTDFQAVLSAQRLGIEYLTCPECILLERTGRRFKDIFKNIRAAQIPTW